MTDVNSCIRYNSGIYNSSSDNDICRNNGNDDDDGCDCFSCLFIDDFFDDEEEVFVVGEGGVGDRFASLSMIEHSILSRLSLNLAILLLALPLRRRRLPFNHIPNPLSSSSEMNLNNDKMKRNEKL
ncbi:hypothetical protein DERP_011008 [Dermatophagoides pteronyssinus]|uniref:Uncharacterized protein n=1 Tax=Dermatophagoides pteronyssinus TaxID=6956 RepID=A0ABQ8JUY6_DERPT|nr:hypothetical protein DERP_011008 [Dermatophagoides pteronyssinus]